MNMTVGLRKGWIGLGAILFFALGACNKKEIPFGENFVESFTDIMIIDTLTPVISTYKLDSFPTSGTGTLLVGSFKDTVFGQTNTSSFFQIGLPTFSINREDLYDSLTLILSPNNEYYGDTTVTQQISVHELTQTIALPTGRFQFYNNRPAFASSPSPLGQRSLKPRPSRSDSIEIRLSDVKGAELFQKLIDRTTEVQNQENFLRYFRGITLKSTPSNAAITGYNVGDTTLKMRLYYRERNITSAKRYIDFPVINTSLQHNLITANRSGTPLKNLPAGFPVVPSSLLDSAAYVQSASGLYGRVSFPSLQNLLNIDKSGRILRAELIIKPVPRSFVTPYRLPAQLNLSLTDRTNAIGPVQATANLFTDFLTGDNTGYTFDLTAYLQNQITVNVVNQQGLLIYSNSATDFSRLVIGDEKSGRSRIQVRIFYLVIK